MKGKDITRRGFVGTAAGGIGLFAVDASAQNDLLLMDAAAVGHETRQDDMPCIAAAPDGSTWVAWVSFAGDRDDVALRHFKDGQWQNIVWVPGTSGDSWLPQVAIDRQNRVWAVWTQQVDAVWDIYARRFDASSQTWSSMRRVSSGYHLPDIYPRIWSDGAGRAAVVWQGFRERTGLNHARSNIFLSVLDDDGWSEEIRVSDGDANEWEPSVAIDSKGNIWVAYDSYKNANYDVFLREVRGGEPYGGEITIAATGRFEARPTVAIDTLDRVWVAWEEGEENWGKDQGGLLGRGRPGKPLGDARQLKVACLDGGRHLTPLSPLASAFREGYKPHVFSDGAGSVFVVAMLRRNGPPMGHVSGKPAYHDYWRKVPFHYYEYWITHLDDNGWRAPVRLPSSKGRCSTRVSAALLPGKRLFLAWPTDNREESYYHRPIRQQVYAGLTAGVAPSRAPRLVPTAAAVAAPVEKREADDVSAIREFRVSGGMRTRLLRGDLHRHTELSWDNGGAQDGSLEDFYRYMFDVACLDFGANTEHQGGAWPYWLWYSEKMTDMHHVPGTYVSLFGYERSASFPHGHRNVFFARRSEVRVTPLFLEDGVSLYSPPLTSEGDEPADESPQLVRNDTTLLFEEVRAHRGIAIPHTTGTGMGTDWHDHDDEVEPVVEIFQGCRQSYEDVGAPYAATPEQIAKDAATPPPPASDRLEALLLAMFRRRPEGMVARAWKKGHRLGVIASSDHISTHISYAMVYTADFSRQGILDAIRRRHTYGATDNIALHVEMGEHFMGDSFSSSRVEPLRIRVRGTGAVARLDVLRDSKVIQSFEPRTAQVNIEFRDAEFVGGKHYYYVRLLQADGMIAWSSPFFLNYEPK